MFGLVSYLLKERFYLSEACKFSQTVSYFLNSALVFLIFTAFLCPSTDILT